MKLNYNENESIEFKIEIENKDQYSLMKHIFKQLQYITPQSHKLFKKQYKFELPSEMNILIKDIQDYGQLLDIASDKLKEALPEYINNKGMQLSFHQFASFNRQYSLKILQSFKKNMEQSQKQKQALEKSISERPFCSCQHQYNKTNILEQKECLKIDSFKDVYNYYNTNSTHNSDLRQLRQQSQQIFKYQQQETSFSYNPFVSTISLEEYEERLHYLQTQMHAKNNSIEKILKDFTSIEKKLSHQNLIYGMEQEAYHYEQVMKGERPDEKLINILKLVVNKYLKNKIQKRSNAQVQVNMKESKVIKQLQDQKKLLIFDLSKLKMQRLVVQERLLAKDKQLMYLQIKKEAQDKQFIQKQAFLGHRYLLKQKQLSEKITQNEHLTTQYGQLTKEHQKVHKKMQLFIKINKELKKNLNIKPLKDIKKVTKDANKDQKDITKTSNENSIHKKTQQQNESSHVPKALRSSHKKQTLLIQERKKDIIEDLQAINNPKKAKSSNDIIIETETSKSLDLMQNTVQKEKKGLKLHASSINYIHGQVQQAKEEDQMDEVRDTTRKRSIVKFKVLSSNKINKRYVDAVSLVNESSINFMKNAQPSIKTIISNDCLLQKSDFIVSQTEERSNLLQKLYQIQLNSEENPIKAKYQEFISYYQQFVLKLSLGIRSNQSHKNLTRPKRSSSKKSIKPLEQSMKSKSKSKFRDSSRSKRNSFNKQKSQIIESTEQVVSKFYKNKGPGSSINQAQKEQYKSANISRQQTVEKKGKYLIQNSKKYGYRQIKQAIKESLINSINEKEAKSIQTHHHIHNSLFGNYSNKEKEWSAEEAQEELKVLTELFQFHKDSRNIKSQQFKENVVLKPKENQYILQILSYLAYLHVNAEHKYTRIIKIIKKNSQRLNPTSEKGESNEQIKLIFNKMILAHKNCFRNHNQLCSHLQRFASQLSRITFQKGYRPINESGQICQQPDNSDFEHQFLQSKNLMESKSRLKSRNMI